MDDLQPYDAVLLVSFGGPEGPDEVLPFMERVTAGRQIPAERLREVSRHYFDHFDGRSPINDENRALLTALTDEFAARGWPQPIVWGNRNAAPFLAETIDEVADTGARRVLAVLTSAYPSYSSCRQYRENLADALGESPVHIDLVTPYAHWQQFATAQSQVVIEALHRLDEATPAPGASVSADGSVVVFVTHSIPVTMNDGAGPDGGGYLRWHQRLIAQVMDEVTEQVGENLPHELAFCSRSGPPQVPWLEPDVNDRLEELADRGVQRVVVVPVGFISDHMEVAYDLDIEASATAARLGLTFVRAATVGRTPTFVGLLCDALADRAARGRREAPRPPLIPGGECWTPCAPGCCPNTRQPGRNSLAS